MRNEFAAIIEQDQGWFIAYSPEIPGANGQGRTQEEAIESLRGAIELILQDRCWQTRVKRPPTVKCVTVHFSLSAHGASMAVRLPLGDDPEVLGLALGRAVLAQIDIAAINSDDIAAGGYGGGRFRAIALFVFARSEAQGVPMIHPPVGTTFSASKPCAPTTAQIVPHNAIALAVGWDSDCELRNDGQRDRANSDYHRIGRAFEPHCRRWQAHGSPVFRRVYRSAPANVKMAR